jgi:hypothetical protein
VAHEELNQLSQFCEKCKNVLGTRAKWTKKTVDYETWLVAVVEVLGDKDKPDGFWEIIRREYDDGCTLGSCCVGMY